jgi:hypothetical protein
MAGTQDLELLKTRKLRGAGAAPPPRATGNNKRYLILTYAAEFDRVHYPLPLLFEEVPDADALQRTIRRLREELDATKGMGYGTVLKGGPDPSDLRRLREENMDLKVSEISLTLSFIVALRKLDRQLVRRRRCMYEPGAAGDARCIRARNECRRSCNG